VPLRVDRSTGSAGVFHAREIPDDGQVHVWWFEVDRPAVALGSRQRTEIVDATRCAEAGIEVVSRRSGGGAVYLEPGGIIWVDVIIPVSDPRWSGDVRDSMMWMGERWTRALEALGTWSPEQLRVHRGGEQSTVWSDLVCFAGIGPGEVLADGRKLVGISQRRTRAGSRFQCAVHLQSAPLKLVQLLRPPLPDIAMLPEVACVEVAAAGELVASLVAAIEDVPRSR
jgi:lipoate-protein ligase A